MEAEQEHELRQWAVALAGTAEADRRAMGRAILMLLDRIDALRAELERASRAPEPEPVEPAMAEQPTGALPAADPPGEVTTVAGLRERLGAAVHRIRE